MYCLTSYDYVNFSSLNDDELNEVNGGFPWVIIPIIIVGVPVVVGGVALICGVIDGWRGR